MFDNNKYKFLNAVAIYLFYPQIHMIGTGKTDTKRSK